MNLPAGHQDSGDMENLVGEADGAIPVFDQAEFAEMVERGTTAWADVPDATEWLENLRANGCR